LLLYTETLDLFLNFFEVFLLGNDEFFNIVVLFLDLAKLDGNFSDFILVVLHSGSIIGWLKKGVLFDEALGTVVQPKKVRNGLDSYLNFFCITVLVVAAPLKLVCPLVPLSYINS